MNIVHLKPFETLTQHKALKRLETDAMKVHECIRTHPGIEGKAAIARVTSLSEQRVHRCIKFIQSGDPGLVRVDYGTAKASGGPNAGQVVTGWFAVNLKSHHASMISAEVHSAVVEAGVRRSRLVRFVQAQGMPHAEAVVAALEESLGESIELMSVTDYEAFEDLLRDQADSL